MRVDMYLLRDGAGDALDLACMLAGKAWPAHAAVQIACRESAQCRQLDERLWRLPPDRFIAHEMTDAQTDEQRAPVVIGTQTGNVADNSLLIELRGGEQVAGNCVQFARILDIVANTDADRVRARRRYLAYRALTDQLHTHELS